MIAATLGGEGETLKVGGGKARVCSRAARA